VRHKLPFDKSDIGPALLYGGFTVLSYGASTLHAGFGFLMLGVLLVLHIKPLGRWIK